MGVIQGTLRLAHLCAQGVNLFLARAEPHQFIRLLQRIDSCDGTVVAGLGVVEHLVRQNLLFDELLAAIQARTGILQIRSSLLDVGPGLGNLLRA